MPALVAVAPVLATRPGVVVITGGAFLRLVGCFWLHVFFACHQCESSETTDYIYPIWRISTSKSLADFNHNISRINNRINITGISHIRNTTLDKTEEVLKFILFVSSHIDKRLFKKTNTYK